ncbi:imidazole glycerol phosphate synthase subunit HisH [Microbacterium sp. NPDC055521]
MTPIAIVDYGVGNLQSIANMLKKAGFDSVITEDHEVISSAEKLILPGVGSFDRAATRLRESGLADIVLGRAQDGAWILGVCLGMQLLLEASEEGREAGLGLVPGTVQRFPDHIAQRRLLVPHMGWSTVLRHEGHDGILPSVQDGSRFYFVHSYHAVPEAAEDVFATSLYGVPFTAMVRRGRVIGAQFHPEKSHRVGMALLTDFARQQ